MTQFVLLNGPPGIGKSTISALYAERHPGTLNLDIDSLHRLVGGWQDVDTRTHDLLRPVALAMTSAHLGGGHDVVLPQYLARAEEIEAFGKVAHDQQADFRELVLLDGKEAAITRFDQRRDDSEWDRHNRRVVEDLGGRAMLASMYDRLLETVDLRPLAMVIRSEPDSVEGTYELGMQTLRGLAGA